MRLPLVQWMPIRYRILVRDNFLCQKCGKGGRHTKIKLEVHHKDGNPMNNDEKNLCVLCTRCHDLHHYGFVRNRKHEFE